MPTPSDSEARREFFGGVRAELPLLLGVVPFGLIFGVLGLAAGLPGWAVVLSSSLVFGGSSQVVFAQLWGGGNAGTGDCGDGGRGEFAARPVQRGGGGISQGFALALEVAASLFAD